MAKTVNITGEDVAAIRRAASVLGKVEKDKQGTALSGVTITLAYGMGHSRLDKQVKKFYK